MNNADNENLEPRNYGTERVFSSLDDIHGKHVIIMGLGLHGGGEAAARFFLQHGAIVTVTDMKSALELEPSLASLTGDSGIDQSRLRFVLGCHRIEDFINADAVIKNPGVKYQGNPYLRAARHIETDISLFLQFSTAPLIAVTGSKGKSSVVSAIHYGLNAAGIPALLGGNITVSPLKFLDKTLKTNQADCTEQKLPVVILELSSWQLADLRGRKLLKPKIALITKIMPDHQNWYGNMESYVADKKLIYADQTKDDFTLCAVYDRWGKEFAAETPAQLIRCPDDINKNLKGSWLNHLQVLGEHNKENILNAAEVMYLAGADENKIISVLQNYSGIPHRLEAFYIWKQNNTCCTFYNDSAATVPEAAAAALNTFTRSIHLIAGGTDKDLEFAPLADALESSQKKHHLLSLFLLAGTGTDKLTVLLQKQVSAGKELSFFGPYNNLESLLLDLKNCIMRHSECTEQNVVFSPGATSFGMFKNEFDRGNKFKELVPKILKN